MKGHWLTVDQLLALAAAGRGEGTRSEYPPETGQQLLALCRLRRRFPHDLDAIRFGLWYERYPLPIDDVKRSMEQLLNPLLRALPLDAPDPLAAAEQLASQARSKPLRSSSGRRLKRLRNTSEVDTVLTAAFQLMLGDVPGFTAHAEEGQQRACQAIRGYGSGAVPLTSCAAPNAQGSQFQATGPGAH